MKQNKEGHESRPAPNDLADGVKGSKVEWTKSLDGAKGAEQVGKKPTYMTGPKSSS